MHRMYVPYENEKDERDGDARTKRVDLQRNRLQQELKSEKMSNTTR